MKFRKKPVVIEAIQWTGNNWADMATIVDETVRLHGPDQLRIKTLESHGEPLFANPTDWIIKGVAGELYPCRADIFAATYDPA